MPHAFADVMRRLNSSRRASSRATSMPPQVLLTPSSTYWRWLSSVRIAISLLWSVGKMKFDACPVEPPGLGSGPLSIRTMSVQPSRAEVPDEAVADDAGPDDDDLGASVSERSLGGGSLPWQVPLRHCGRGPNVVDLPFIVCAPCRTGRHSGDISSPYHGQPETRYTSLGERAYEAIRRMIVRLELAPGDVVREDELQRQLGMGRTPIREALQRLAREQFVTVMPRRGMFVRASTSTELAHALRDPCGDRAVRTRLACARGDAAHWQTMTDALVRAGGRGERRRADRHRPPSATR